MNPSYRQKLYYTEFLIQTLTVVMLIISFSDKFVEFFASFITQIPKNLLIINQNLYYLMYHNKNTKYKRCTILLKEDIYKRLKTKGKFGESFSELISRF